MKRIALVLAIPALALAAPALAGNSTSTHTRSVVRTCSDLVITFEDEPAAVSEEVLIVKDTELTARAGDNGGVYVFAEDRGDFSIKVCRAAQRPQDLAGIEVRFEGSTLQTRGPRHGDWLVNLIVLAPRAAKLDFAATNGPISVRGLAGSLQAESVNGPISIKDCAGEIKARADNGPIAVVDSPGTIDVESVNGPLSVTGSAGRVRARTQNGPVSVEARGSDWDGDLDASTSNGPVSLELPDGFAGTATVTSKGRSPVKCKHQACRDGMARYWDDDGDPRIQIGSGQPVIRLSTSNGPVTVASAH
jgi:hypothetical protein